MNRFSRLLVILLVITNTAFAQESIVRDVILLKSGEKVQGKIISQTDKVLTLKTDDGKRFQFQLSEIVSIEQEETTRKPEVKPTQHQGNFTGIIEINGGVASAKATPIPASPAMAVSLAFGSKNAFGSNGFLGLGVGYETSLAKNNSNKLTFLPVFILLQKTFTTNKTAPFIASHVGYTFKLNENYGGGAYFKLSGGVNFQIAEKTAFNIGLFGKIQQISGTIIEQNHLGEFMGEGNTKLYSAGLSLSFIF
ncbi:MAG TPA: hypothetical protein GXZ87_00470 [Bacteroidales bacterium]|nr:hypothetical protein [Bacteroidales bacterium]